MPNHFTTPLTFSKVLSNLSTSKCTRTRNANNTITEFVELDGSRGELTDEELQRFVAGFPIHDAAQKRAEINK